MGNVRIYAAWKAYQQNAIPESELERIIRQNATLIKLPIDVNSICNLQCLHCSYYLPQRKQKDELTIKQFCDVADQAMDMGIKVIASAGKEPLLVPEKTAALFSHIRERSTKTITGIVTNGTLVDDRRLETLQRMGLTYINVSIDGTEEYHDKNRGAGEFKKAFEGLKRIRRGSVAKEVLVSATLMSYNADNLRELMDYCANNANVTDFYVGCYIATGRNPDDWRISARTVTRFLDQTQDYDGNVIMDVHSDTQPIWDELIRIGYISEDEIFEDGDGIVAAKVGKHHVMNSMFTTNYWSVLLVSSTGHAFGDYCLREDRDYLKDPRVVGNVKERSLRELFDMSINIGFPYFLEKMRGHRNGDESRKTALRVVS